MKKIFVIDTKNRRVIFEVNDNETIRNLKIKIKTKMGINNNNDIDLLYGGDILHDDDRISECEIENLGVITYLGQFKGGIYLNIFNKLNI